MLIPNSVTREKLEATQSFLEDLGWFWSVAPKGERLKIALELAGGNIIANQAAEWLEELAWRVFWGEWNV